MTENVKSDEARVRVPGRPDLCDHCGRRFLELVADAPADMPALFTYCPHTFTAVIAWIGRSDDDGLPTIHRWAWETPIDQERALALARQVEAKTQTSMVVEPGRRLQ